jgi:hypothetical protein
MTYAMTAALQAAVYGRLVADPGVQAVVGGNVFDAAPGGALPETYVVMGEETVAGRHDASGAVARHDLVVSVLSDAAGFATAKAAAAAVSAALDGAALTLSQGRLVDCRFRRAKAKRGTSPGSRQVDLTFRALVEDM